MQPRWLVAQLEEFDYQSDYQAELSSSLLSQHQQLQGLSEDNLNLAKTDIHAVHEVLVQLQAEQEERRNQALHLQQRCEQQVSHSQQQQQQSVIHQDNGEQQLSHWQHQQCLAADWQAEAELALSGAQSSLSTAEQKRRQAEQIQNRAQHALSVAQARPPTRVRIGGSDENPVYRNDPPDCSYELSALTSANAECRHRQQKYQHAVQRVNQAQQQLSKAQSQKHGTDKAVQDSKQTLALTAQGLETAHQADTKAQQALEHAQAGLSSIEHIDRLLQQLVQLEDAQSQTLQLMQNALHESYIHLKELAAQQESMQGEGFNLKYTLQDKTTLLLAFDQPLILS